MAPSIATKALQSRSGGRCENQEMRANLSPAGRSAFCAANRSFANYVEVPSTLTAQGQYPATKQRVRSFAEQRMLLRALQWTRSGGLVTSNCLKVGFYWVRTLRPKGQAVCFVRLCGCQESEPGPQSCCGSD